MKNKIVIVLLSFVMAFMAVMLPSQAQASMNLSGAAVLPGKGIYC